MFSQRSQRSIAKIRKVSERKEERKVERKEERKENDT